MLCIVHICSAPPSLFCLTANEDCNALIDCCCMHVVHMGISASAYCLVTAPLSCQFVQNLCAENIPFMHSCDSSLMASLYALQVDSNPPDSRSKKAVLPTFPESPDSPLVFPWSQGPSSTGAASAYASLSDSYLSRPPSQAPSPSKQGRFATPAAASPAKRAQHDSFRSLSAQHAQQEPAGASSPAHCAQITVDSPSQTLKRPLELMWCASGGAISSLVCQSDSPVGQVGSPSGPPLPNGHAFQSQSSAPLSNGPVSVAPWRQQRHTSTSTAATPQSPPLGSPAATARVQLPQLHGPATTAGTLPPQLGTSATTSTLQISPDKLPSTAASHHLTGEGQQPTKPASEASEDHAMMKPQQSVDVAQHDTEMKFPWQQQRPASNGLLQLNGGRNNHNDAASSASGDSSFAPASSHAGAPASANDGAAPQELERRNGSTHTLHKGELLARLLDESMTCACWNRVHVVGQVLRHARRHMCFRPCHFK